MLGNVCSAACSHYASRRSKLAPIMSNASLWLTQIHFLVSLGFLTLFLLIELGLSWTLLFFKLGAHRAKGAGWTAAYRFWVRVFALASVLAFAASIPVLIQIGSLWPGLMDRIGNIAGPLLAAAILTTFIFKSCFLGAMLFGQRQLSDHVHTMVVAMVAVGVTLASLCMVILQSWMQTPTGAVLINGEYLVMNWADIASNASMPWLAALLGAGAALTAAFLLLGVSARQSMRHPLSEGELLSFRTGQYMALGAGLVLALALLGYGQNMAEHQPAKAAATMGYWKTGSATDFPLLGWPDSARQETRYALRLPGAAASWLGRDLQGQSLGLDRYAGMHAPVLATFWSFRIVLGVGLLMVLIAVATFVRLRRHDVDPAHLSRTSRRLLSASMFSGWVLGAAILCHVLLGLSPWAVNNTVTLAEVSASHPAALLSAGLLVHALVYLLFIAAFYQLLRHISHYGVIPVARRRGRA